MELPDSTEVRLKKQKAALEQETPNGGVSLFVRLWTYAGPSQQFSGLALDEDSELAELIRSLITDGKGQITEQRGGMLVARFTYPLFALAAAKTLQQRLLTFHR